MRILHQRKFIRLKDYDYSREGLYFVTICTQNRECLLGDIVGTTRGSSAHMELNETGKIIENIWESLPDHHPVELDVFQIMPNHIHFIIQIVDTGRSRPTPTLGTIVGLFKSECTKQINIVVGTTRGSSARGSSIWQRNYYEHIIRNEVDLNKIREYILFNPQMWERDRNNLKNHLI